MTAKLRSDNVTPVIQGRARRRLDPSVVLLTVVVALTAAAAVVAFRVAHLAQGCTW